MNIRARWVGWLLLGVLLGCGGGSSGGGSGAGNPAVASANIGQNGGTLTSLDGKVTLTIPAGALGNTQTITIESIDPATLTGEFAGIEADLAYELKPDGLQFNPPAQVTLKLDDPAQPEEGAVEKGVSVLLTSANGKIEPLGNLVLTVDADGNTATLRGELTHFSKLVKSATLFDNVTISGFPDRPVQVGVPFTIKVKVTHAAESDLTASRVVYEEDFGNPILDVTEESKKKFTQENLGQIIVLGSIESRQAKSLQETVDYVCKEEGVGFYSVFVTFQERVSSRHFGLVEGDGVEALIGFEKNVVCQGVDTASGKTSQTAGNGKITFSVNPPIVTERVGATFHLAVGEEFTQIPNTVDHETEVGIRDIPSEVVSAPQLGDPPTSAGTDDVALRVLAPGFAVMHVDDMREGKNTQNLKYKCEKEGNTILVFHMSTGSDFPGTTNLENFFLIVQVECREPKQTGFFRPFDSAPNEAVAWRVRNAGTNHIDGPFALPDAPNPGNLMVLHPQELTPGAFWEVSNTQCNYIHLAGEFGGHVADEDTCRHGGLEYLLAGGGPPPLPEFFDPFALPPPGAVAWKLVNPDIGHEDGPFALPGAPNPDGLPVLHPLDDFSGAFWIPPDLFPFFHLHGPFQGHDDPAPGPQETESAGGHGGLVYLFQ